MDAGFPILLADATGHRLTPSLVYFPEAGEPMVGRAAEDWRTQQPERTVYSVKRLMGTRTGEVDIADLPYRIGGAAGGPARVWIGQENRSPEEISALVLGKLKLDAERALGRGISRAVITVPAYFNDAQRQATKTAGEMAGLQVERIINEPTAAALAYGLDKLGDKSKLAVYDLGGGTFDISILELDAGIFQVLATNGNTRLGGDDIDTALAGYLARAFDRLQEAGYEVNAARWLEAARRAKIALSTETDLGASVHPDSEKYGDLHVRLNREKLDELARPIVERTRTHCLRALADARLSPRRSRRRDPRRRRDPDAAGARHRRGHLRAGTRHLAEPG